MTNVPDRHSTDAFADWAKSIVKPGHGEQRHEPFHAPVSFP